MVIIEKSSSTSILIRESDDCEMEWPFFVQKNFNGDTPLKELQFTKNREFMGCEYKFLNSTKRGASIFYGEKLEKSHKINLK